MTAFARIAGAIALLCASLAGSPASASTTSTARVGEVRPSSMQVRLDKDGGRRWREVTETTKVFLRDRAGNRTAADIDELVRGARVVGSRVVDGTVRRITIQERPATGSADCSFDSSDDDGDAVTDRDSFDCSHDYDDGTVHTDTDCSYDSSRDGPPGDWSMDASWDCSYSETDDRDEDDPLDWDCSYSVSAGASIEADGGDTDADLDFDCSWSGADTDSPLWDCRFLPGELGFRCASSQLGQEFSYTVDVETMAVEGGMDFQQDVIVDESGPDGLDCSGSPGSGYDCSVDGELGNGDCSVDWSFDRSAATRSGDVGGSLSYSCSWDA